MLHGGKCFRRNDLHLLHQELRWTLNVEVAPIQTSHKDDPCPNFIWSSSHWRLPPALVYSRQLSELLRLLWTFDSRSTSSNFLYGPDQVGTWDVAHSEPCCRNRCPSSFDVDPVVGISESKLDAICIIADRVIRSPWTNPELPPWSSEVARDHCSIRSSRVGSATALERQHGDPPSLEHSHHHGELRCAHIHRPDQDLVHELLLHSEVCISPVSTKLRSSGTRAHCHCRPSRRCRMLRCPST